MNENVEDECYFKNKNYLAPRKHFIRFSPDQISQVHSYLSKQVINTSHRLYHEAMI
jgi:hypothetical protein